MKSRYLILTGIIILLIMNCTKPYLPKAITAPYNYLVVEGAINTGGNDSTLIKLSRTVPLNSGGGTKDETGASVTIQDQTGPLFSLREIKPGIYLSDVINLSNMHQYRLNITTADGIKYVTDYITPLQPPPIDSIGFVVKSNGLQIYANTHDPNNSTHYYRWDYTETWQFHSRYFSNYVSSGIGIAVRDTSQYIYECWSNSISTGIILGSSAKLAQDVIYQNPIAFVPSNSEKMEFRYSILLKQYALSADGYNYFELLQKNTDQLGGIFDPQPSQLTGNVHCITDPSVPAIGYITAGSIQQKRIFIDHSQLPVNWVPLYPYDCDQDTALYVNPVTLMNDVQTILQPLNNSNIPTEAIYPGLDHRFPIGFKYSQIDCVDCSVRGTLTKPSFWTN
jgi:hypothetical protein